MATLDGVRIVEPAGAADNQDGLYKSVTESASAATTGIDAARANLLRALTLPPEARVLEVGAGRGEMTHYLGERVALVDAIEPVASRARLAHERTRDLPGVQVFQGFADDVPLEPAYDVIVAIDVLSHAAGGSSDSQAYVDFLQGLRKRLVAGGSLVLGVENKLAVKYLSGAPDESTGRPFASIEDYPDGTDARAFAPNVLVDLMHRAGFDSPHLLSVFPDLRSTSAVFDAERLAAVAPDLIASLPTFQEDGALANEQRVWRELVAAGVAEHFANAYLVLAGAGPEAELWPDDQVARTFSVGRRPEYATTTSVVIRNYALTFDRTCGADAAAAVMASDTTWKHDSSPSLLTEFLRSDDEGRRSLLARWRELLAERSNGELAPFDLLPHRVVVRPGGEVRAYGIEFRMPESVDRVIDRGVLWFGIELARQTTPATWPPADSVRDVVLYVAELAGLDRFAARMDAVVDAEARFQSTVSTLFTGDDAVARWVAEINASLDRSLWDMPLGLRLPDRYERAVAELREWEERRPALYQEIERLNEELERRHERWSAQVTHLEAEMARRHERWSAEVERINSENAEVTARIERLREHIAGIEQERDAALDARGAMEQKWRRTDRDLKRLRKRPLVRLALVVMAFVGRVAPERTKRRKALRRVLLFVSAGFRPIVRVVRPRRKARNAGAVETSWTMATIAELHVPHTETPDVSIVIPVYGKLDYTVQCLSSIARHFDGEALEVVVVDDASPDGSVEQLRKIRGLRVVGLEENVGFTRAANRGIAEARGRQVVLLNNDTAVTKGWLGALLAAGEDENVGLVGARLVYPDGQLQEAGGIIFSDGDGWNYGRFGDQTSPQYNFRRKVDYVSGAVLLLTERLLAQVSGFDERYAPAYYEDTDLAFTTRELGLDVVYEPACLVIHYEGISHGTDVTSGMKRYQEINRVKFLEKWASQLAQQPEHEGVTPENVARVAMRRGIGTVVIVDHTVPTWREDSGSLRMKRIIDNLQSLGYDVVFVPDNLVPIQPYTRELQEAGALVWHGDEDFLSYLCTIKEEIRFLMVCRAGVAVDRLQAVRTALPDVPVVFDTVDLHFLRLERGAAIGEGHAAAAKVIRELELAMMRLTDATFVVSDVEKDLLEELVPEVPVYIVPNVHDRHGLSTRNAERTEITFVGSFAHQPNGDAVRWFVNEIFPLVRARVPEAHFTVVGKNPPQDLVDAQPEGVAFLGWVEDLVEVHDRTLVSVAPLRYGAGVKGKVGDAWAHGLPVVMTSVAAEGMAVTSGVNGFVADQPQEFADAIVRLIEDPEAWDVVARGGWEHVETVFGSVQLRTALEAVASHLAG